MNISSRTINNFWKKVDKSGDCWEWTGSGNGNGYGKYNLKGKMFQAHRLAYILEKGPIPEGEGYHGTCVLHSCDNRLCVNPKHLSLGTQKENIEDSVNKGRHFNPSGERHGRAKLSWAKVAEIKELFGSMTQNKIAEMYGVHQSIVSGIKLGRIWRTT